MSHLLTEICKLLGVEKLNTTAYHPQTDGLVECFNHTLTDMLAKKLSRVERIGIITFLLCYLHIELVYRSQQMNHHSIVVQAGPQAANNTWTGQSTAE